MGRNPEVPGFNYSRIPPLVEQAVSGRKGRSPLARQELIARLNRDPNYDPVLFAIEGIQRQILKKLSPSVIETGTSFLQELIFRTGDGEINDGRKSLNLSPEVSLAAQRMTQNDRRLRQDPHLEQMLPENYTRFMTYLPPWIKSAVSKGERRLEIAFARKTRPGEDFTQRDEAVKRYQDWASAMTNFISQKAALDPNEYARRDAFIDLLRSEPEQDFYRETKLFSTAFGDLSLQQIETLPIPLTKADFSRYLDYLNGLLSNKPSALRSFAIRELFFSALFYPNDGTSDGNRYRNQQLISRLSALQEGLVLLLINGADPVLEQKAVTVLKNLSDDQALTFLAALFQWNVRPDQLDPKQTDMDRNGAHQFYHKAITDYLQRHPASFTPFAYGDEIARQYFEQNTLPLLEQKISQLGLETNLAQAIAAFRELLEKVPFEQEHLSLVTDCIERNCGEELLKKLDTKTPEIAEITKLVWDSILKKGMHYLPAATGEDKIVFSDESLPHLLGVESVSFHLTGSLENWQVIVIFDLANSNLRLLSRLDNNGAISFRAPLEKYMPGMAAMLRHIAVLTFRDLVVQRQREDLNPRPKINHPPQIVDIDPDGKNIIVLNPLKHRSPSTISSTPLPRVQSDASLTKDASLGARYTPRLVHIHAMWLPGAKAYCEAINAYPQALEEVSPDFIELLAENLDQLRKKMYQAAPEKITTFPAHLEQVAITDPITEKVINLKTWVLEHPSPAMTEEEKGSPIKQFQRYYSDSSALASLEPLKIWLFETA